MIDDSDEANSETREAIEEHLEPTPEIREWVVRWEAGISASSPLEAAREAHRMMQDPSAMAPILEVFEEEPGDWEAEGTLVDLNLEAETTWDRPMHEHEAEYDAKAASKEMTASGEMIQQAVKLGKAIESGSPIGREGRLVMIDQAASEGHDRWPTLTAGERSDILSGKLTVSKDVYEVAQREEKAMAELKEEPPDSPDQSDVPSEGAV